MTDIYLDVVNANDSFFLDIVSETSVVNGDIAVPSLEIAMIGVGYNDPGPGVYAYDQSGGVWYPLASRFFIRKSGDPVPPNLNADDLVFLQN